MEELTLLGERAVQAKFELQRMMTEKKNEVLEAVADALIKNTEYLLLENHRDLERGIANQMNPGLLDRLRLTKERITGMAEGIRQIVKRSGERTSYCKEESSHGRHRNHL